MPKSENTVESKSVNAVAVHAKDLFEQKKKEQTFDITKPLPKSGIDVTYPNFISHDESMAVMAKAGVTSSSAKKSAEGKRKLVSFAASIFCRFGPNKDKMSHVDIGRLMEKEDTSWLASRILGEDEGDEESEDPDLGKG